MITLLLVFLVFIIAIMLVFAIVGAIAVSPMVLLIGLFAGADFLIIRHFIGNKKDKK